ncbi:Bro-N domain-containing protein [Cupriavidus sp. UYPR2.512]|uniref:BRO-N domain-containing protein n=1 Tax=Cupriavidus sp. UYPR2.512 TaxID=1080187 RepID=UPI00035F04F0|nr:Bro-N domain-containing protein [Cupriavidus sp. UYPR2.512]UIF90895.1 Bro-N domain-containing protein [Cupriavidus necator]
MPAPSLLSFNFQESNSVRVVIVDGEPWFAATDVCRILGYRDAFNATRLLDEDEKGTHILSTLGGEQVLSIINESGLYALVIRSRKPEARRFRKWVTSEVIPSIRKTGSYTLPSQLPRITHPEPQPAHPIKPSDYKNLEGRVHLLAGYFGRKESTSRAIWAHLREQLGVRVTIRNLPADRLDDAQQILSDLQTSVRPYIRARNEFDRAWLQRLLGGSASTDLLH